MQEYSFSQASAGKQHNDEAAILFSNALLAAECPLLTLLTLAAFPLRELEAPPPPPLSTSSSTNGGSLGEPSPASPLLHALASPPRSARGGMTTAVGEAREEEEEALGVGDLLFTRRGEGLGAGNDGTTAGVPSSTEYII